MSVLTGGLLIVAGLVLTFALVQCAMLALARYRPDPELEAQVRDSYERRPPEEAQRECQRRAWTSWQAIQALKRGAGRTGRREDGAGVGGRSAA